MNLNWYIDVIIKYANGNIHTHSDAQNWNVLDEFDGRASHCVRAATIYKMAN